MPGSKAHKEEMDGTWGKAASKHLQECPGLFPGEGVDISLLSLIFDLAAQEGSRISWN